MKFLKEIRYTSGGSSSKILNKDIRVTDCSEGRMTYTITIKGNGIDFFV